MPTPNCPRCQGTSFSGSLTFIPFATPKGSLTVLIHCSSCGCVVGTAPQVKAATPGGFT